MSVSEFKATCLKVIERLRKTGESILILKNGEPAVVVGPVPITATSGGYACMREKMKITGDIISPLDEEWEAIT